MILRKDSSAKCLEFLQTNSNQRYSKLKMVMRLVCQLDCALGYLSADSQPILEFARARRRI